VGLGTPDVLATVSALRQRGVTFVESEGLHSDPRGALTQGQLGGVMFELVHDERK
jgi:4-hydroxyphenylpyruvate dioxygenase